MRSGAITYINEHTTMYSYYSESHDCIFRSAVFRRLCLSVEGAAARAHTASAAAHLGQGPGAVGRGDTQIDRFLDMMCRFTSTSVFVESG